MVHFLVMDPADINTQPAAFLITQAWSSQQGLWGQRLHCTFPCEETPLKIMRTAVQNCPVGEAKETAQWEMLFLQMNDREIASSVSAKYEH